MAAWVALVILIASGFILVGRHDAVTIGGQDAADLAMAASGLLLTVWLSGALLPQMRETHPRAYRRILMFGGLSALLAVTIWLRAPLRAGADAAWTAWGQALPLPHVLTETIVQWRRAVASPAVASPGEKAVRIIKRPDGHFHAAVTLNGTPATLLVDSGATLVLLKAADARDAGIDVTLLSFNTPVATAHGTTYVAHARLRQLRVGVIVAEDIEVLIARPGSLETSLLGMNFLNKLRSYEFSGPFLTLRG